MHVSVNHLRLHAKCFTFKFHVVYILGFTFAFAQYACIIYDIYLHDTMQNKMFCKCKSMCSTLMKVLHYPLLLEIMVCIKMKALHLTLFIGGCGSKSKQDHNKCKMKKGSSL
jgi:hypothetical protein